MYVKCYGVFNVDFNVHLLTFRRVPYFPSECRLGYTEE